MIIDGYMGQADLRWSDISDLGDLMTVSDFLASVDDGLLIDYDGHGDLATADKKSNIVIIPSLAEDILERYKMLDITHVVWYNR